MKSFFFIFALAVSAVCGPSYALEPEEFIKKVKTGELEQDKALELLQNDQELTMKILGINSSSLLDMARYGDEEKILSLLNGGADIMQTNSEGMTPLMIAAQYNGNAKAIAVLADAEKQRTGKISPEVLPLAVLYNNLEAVRTLVETGADINARTAYGLTPLMAAALGSENIAVRWLIEHGADVNAKYIPGHYPADKVYGNTVASVFLRTARPASALSLAVLDNQYKHRADIAETLTAAGARVSAEEYLVSSEKGQTDLFALRYPEDNPYRGRLLEILVKSGQYVGTGDGSFNWK